MGKVRTTISVDKELLEMAKKLRINISQAAEVGIRICVAKNAEIADIIKDFYSEKIAKALVKETFGEGHEVLFCPVCNKRTVVKIDNKFHAICERCGADLYFVNGKWKYCGDLRIDEIKILLENLEAVYTPGKVFTKEDLVRTGDGNNDA